MTTPFLASCFYVVGVLAIIGGIVLCSQLWPGKVDPGYRWLTSAYMPALTWLFTGLLSGLFSFAVGAGLTYLKAIYENTQMSEPELRRSGLVRKCPDCTSVIDWTASVCKFCGHIFAPETAIAELGRIMESADDNTTLSAIHILMQLRDSGVKIDESRIRSRLEQVLDSMGSVFWSEANDLLKKLESKEDSWNGLGGDSPTPNCDEPNAEIEDLTIEELAEKLHKEHPLWSMRACREQASKMKSKRQSQ